MTKIVHCDCRHEGQDKLFGKGQRLHNSCKYPAKSGDPDSGWRCTVCGKEKSK